MLGTEYLRAIFFGLAIAIAGGVQAQDAVEEPATPLDEVLLKNGSRILGTVTSARDGVIVIETDFAGALSIKSDTVDSMRTQGSLVLQLVDGRIIRDKPIVLEEDKLLVSIDGGEQRSYGLKDILLVNPEPWELGDGYKAFGLASVAWSLERGNTDTDELDYKLESFWRSLEDRYTLKVSGEIDEANDVKSADNWQVEGKYDYFLDSDNYWGVKANLEQDEFVDLDLRALIGPYYGWQFYEAPIFTLSVELGLSYVDENFITAEDQDYTGANWDVHASSNYLGGESKLYLDHVGLWNLDETSEIILDTTFGLLFPLLGSLEAAAEIVIRYDAGAVEDVDEVDETYRFRIGYSW